MYIHTLLKCIFSTAGLIFANSQKWDSRGFRKTTPYFLHCNRSFATRNCTSHGPSEQIRRRAAARDIWRRLDIIASKDASSSCGCSLWRNNPTVIRSFHFHCLAIWQVVPTYSAHLALQLPVASYVSSGFASPSVTSKMRFFFSDLLACQCFWVSMSCATAEWNWIGRGCAFEFLCCEISSRALRFLYSLVVSSFYVVCNGRMKLDGKRLCFLSFFVTYNNWRVLNRKKLWYWSGSSGAYFVARCVPLFLHTSFDRTSQVSRSGHRVYSSPEERYLFLPFLCSVNIK